MAEPPIPTATQLSAKVEFLNTLGEMQDNIATTSILTHDSQKNELEMLRSHRWHVVRLLVGAVVVIALLLLFGSVVNLVLLRLGFFSDPQRFFDSVFGSARTLRISRLGGSYEAPQVFEFQPLDVPPLELACAKRPVIPLNEEWDSLNGAA